MNKTYRYACYDKEGRIIAVIFTDLIDVVVKGGTFSKWEVELWTKERGYLGGVICEDYKYEEANY